MYTNISNFYDLKKLQQDLDFVDINLENDNLLFIDPRLIEMGTDKYSKAMHKHIEAFWGELIKKIRSKDKRGIVTLLSGMKEPNETKLGYASTKKTGNSISSKIKPKLIDALANNLAVKTGILSHFGDVELFIEDISCDRISDITTKIIKSVLIEYTIEQCTVHNIKPLFKVKQEDIFDPTTMQWHSRDVFLPVYDGKPILFVPKNIVRLENSANKNMSSFYRYAIRHFVANDKNMISDISPSGKDGKLLLRDVQAKHPVSKTSLSNWMIIYGPLLVDYKSNVLRDKLKPLTDSELMSIIYDRGSDSIAS